MISAFGVEHVEKSAGCSKHARKMAGCKDCQEMVAKADARANMRAWETQTAAAKRPGTGAAPGAGLQEKVDEVLKPAKKATRLRLFRH